MTTGEYETLRNEQRKLEQELKTVRDESDAQYAFIRSTLQKHIDHCYENYAGKDLTDAMLELVREGKASMTVSYNLYPVEKGEDNDGT